MCILHRVKQKENSRKLILVVEPVLNIWYEHSFCDFVKVPQKFLPFLC